MNAADDDLELDHATDIAALLNEVAKAKALVHLQGAAGDELTLQALAFEATDGRLHLRLPGLQAQAPDWTLHAPLHAHTMLGKVRIDFDLDLDTPRQVVEQSGLPVLALGAPSRVRRHQRRHAYRVTPLSKQYPRASLSRPGQTRPLRMGTQDLSASGVALVWPQAIAAPAPGQRLDGVELELERGQRIAVNLQVEHVRPGFTGEWVVGCAYVQLPAQSERQLLLHLNQLQRMHRMLGR